MNTAKILDVVPQTAPPANPPVQPSVPDARSVPPVGNDSNAGLVDQQSERQAHAAVAQRRHAQSSTSATKPHLDREVGYAGDSFAVVVDLVNPKAKNYRVRIFGPPDNSAPPPAATASPASAHAAYSAGAAPALAATVKAEV